MKIGFPSINYEVDCKPNKKFKLQSYSEQNFLGTAKSNLECTKKTILENIKKGYLFFRISSDAIPFASHPICKVNWQKEFQKEFGEIGEIIKKHGMRISMHPDQFVVINSPNNEIVQRSVKELEYHADVLDLMNLGEDAKIQIHVGGVYDDKEESITRFVKNFNLLPEKVKRRLAIENDDVSYSVKDCLKISKQANIPIIFDYFHHECLNNNEKQIDVFNECKKTWKKKDGVMMLDYSSQQIGERKGKHTETLNENHFNKFLNDLKGQDFDLMLEIKDKQKSAEKALIIINSKSQKKN